MDIEWIQFVETGAFTRLVRQHHLVRDTLTLDQKAALRRVVRQIKETT